MVKLAVIHNDFEPDSELIRRFRHGVRVELSDTLTHSDRPGERKARAQLLPPIDAQWDPEWTPRSASPSWRILTPRLGPGMRGCGEALRGGRDYDAQRD